jgi:hypothetical protein
MSRAALEITITLDKVFVGPNLMGETTHNLVNEIAGIPCPCQPHPHPMTPAHL